MRHSSTFTSAFAAAFLLLFALAPASPNFERRWHWYIADAGRSAAQLPDGGYLFSGGMQVTTSSFGVVLARTNELGETTSVRQVQNVDPDGGLSCRLADGSYVLLAESSGTIMVRKFGPAGDSAWDYRSTGGGLVWATVPTFDGGCLVAGRIPDTAYDMGVIKLAADGRQEWARTYDEPRMFDSRARGAAQTRDSGYILCGDANDYTSVNMRLVRLRPNGDTVWTRLHHGPVGPMLIDVREMSDGGFLAVGYEYDTLAAHQALYMMRTNSTGDTVWTRHVSPPGAATQATALCATRDGGYMIAGSIDWGDSARAWLVKTDADGDTMWTRAVGGPWRETAADVEQTMDGGYVVAGTSEVSGGRLLAIKTDSLGRVGVEEPPSLASHPSPLSLSPNPASGFATLSFTGPLGHSGTSTLSLSIYDVTGHLLHSSLGLRASSFLLDLRSMPAGVYLVRLDYDGGSATRKLVVE